MDISVTEATTKSTIGWFARTFLGRYTRCSRNTMPMHLFAFGFARFKTQFIEIKMQFAWKVNEREKSATIITIMKTMSKPTTITQSVHIVQSVNTFSSHIVYYLCALCDGCKYLYQESIIGRVRAKCIRSLYSVCHDYVLFIVAAITWNEIRLWFDSPLIWMNLKFVSWFE